MYSVHVCDYSFYMYMYMYIHDMIVHVHGYLIGVYTAHVRYMYMYMIPVCVYPQSINTVYDRRGYREVVERVAESRCKKQWKK